jgi:hypothetical protein
MSNNLEIPEQKLDKAVTTVLELRSGTEQKSLFVKKKSLYFLHNFLAKNFILHVNAAESV